MELGGYAIHPAAEAYPLIEGDDFDALCDDMRDRGQLEPIILFRTDEGTVLLDGRNRLRVCLLLGIEPEFDYYEDDEPAHYISSINSQRRHLTPSQRAMAAAHLKPMLAAEAEARMKAGVAPEEEPDGNSSIGSGTARDQAGAAHNVSGRYVDKAEKVLDQGSEELVNAVRAGELSVEMGEKLAKRPTLEQGEIVQKIKNAPDKNAKAIIRKHDKDKVLQGIRSEPQALPEGPFRVITADPAWMYDKRQEDGTQRGQTLYPTMTIQEICDLGPQVQAVAHDDCVLWLWITNAHLVAGVHVEVLQAWGFVGKTMLTWDKGRMGTGDWLRGATEHCILAVRGKAVVDLTNQTTLLRAPRSDEHSEKPDEFYELVEGLCPGAKLEMFSRKGRENWQAWGAEAGKLG